MVLFGGWSGVAVLSDTSCDANPLKGLKQPDARDTGEDHEGQLMGLQQVMVINFNTYPFDPDLEASLVAPDGTTVVLFTKVGGGPGNNHANFTNTIFDDNASTPIQRGSSRSRWPPSEHSDRPGRNGD